MANFFLNVLFKNHLKYPRFIVGLALFHVLRHLILFDNQVNIINITMKEFILINHLKALYLEKH